MHNTITFRLSLVCLLFLVVCGGHVTSPIFAGSPEVASSGVVERELPSGAKALLWPRPGSGTVLITVAVPAGSQDEPEEMGGLSHYLEHLLFDGFDDLDERGVTEAFERLSAYMNAFTREQATVYFALVPRADAVAAAELMAGMLTRSTIGPEVYEKEKKVILEELAKDHASPDGLKEEKLRSVLWVGTPLEHPVGGTVESVGATTRDEVVRYWEARYLPSGYRLLVTGDLSVDGLAAALAPFEALTETQQVPGRSDPLSWNGWGEWAAAAAPEGPTAPAGMSSMGMDHGRPGSVGGPEGGTLSVVVAAPDSLATSSTALELLARWLQDASGPLETALGPEWSRGVSVARVPRDPRDLVEIRIKAVIGVEAGALLSRVLGALNAAAVGPEDAQVSVMQRAWSGERALNDQRLHYAAVFYGEALASGRGSLIESVAPKAVTGEELRFSASELLGDASERTRAAWLGDGGPSNRTPLPAAVEPPTHEAAEPLQAGPLGSLTTTLDNGLMVGILPEEGSDVFGLHLLVADRSLREPVESEGISDLVHRLLPGGTVLGGEHEIARRIERAGIEVKAADSPAIPFDNRYHVPDFSYVRLEGPAESLSLALLMLAEMIREPAWDEDGWRTAIDGHKSAKKSDSRGSEKARQIFMTSLLGPNHPLARPVSGQPDSAPASPESVLSFWQSWPDGFFSPDRLVVTVASPFPATETLAVIKDAFSGGPDGAPVRGPYPERVPTTESPEVEIGEAPQITVLWGRIAEVAAEDRAALLVAMDALSDRMTAVVREREGLAYRLGAGVRPIPGGDWILSATVGTRPENSERVAELLELLVTELSSEPFPASDLERLNARARRTRMLRGLSAASRAYRVGRALFEGPGSPLAIDEEAYGSVTPEQVQAAVQKYLVPENMMLVVSP